MARGDVSKAFSYYKKNGGKLGRSEFIRSDQYALCLARIKEERAILPPALPDSLKRQGYVDDPVDGVLR